MVQQANNSQNLNRYSYVINNPLRYTDPSGYNFLDLAAKWMPTVMAVVVAAIPGIGPVMGGAMAGWVGSGFTLKGAALGAFSGAIFNGIGNTFGADSGFFSEGGLGHITSHGLAGGVISVLRGGNFGHGFFSAGFSKFAMSNAGFNYNDISASAITGRTIIAALIGGTSSVISGGKFANGAQTAAMAHLFNAELTNYRTKIKNWRMAEKVARGRLRKEGYTIVEGRTSAKYDGDWYIRGREHDVVGYKIVDGRRVYKLLEVKFVRRGNFKLATKSARKAIGMRKIVQLLVISRQVYFDLHAETVALSGKGFSEPSPLSSDQFTIEWEFIRPNGKGMVYTVGNKEFLDKILEFTGG